MSGVCLRAIAAGRDRTDMYAQCPSCRTIFSASAEQLETAGGRVRCGHCYKPFNAYDHLVDETGDVVLEEINSAEAPEPRQVLREEAALSEEDGATGQAEAEAQEELQISPIAAAVEQDSTPARAETEVTADAAPSEQQAPRDSQADSPPVGNAVGQAAVPDLLQGDLSHLQSASDPSWLVRVARLTALALLLLALAFQYAWFMPTELLHRVPAAQPALAWLFERLHRELPVPRDMSRIHLLSRDVRVHPNFGNVLLVNAQLVNKAQYSQPYPTVRLILFGVNGNVIAARGFRPQDYLTPEVRIDRGMQPGTPVQVGLELVAPGTTAVSYEFQFL
ncbi:MAG: DUF3426 domain-containing protein [Gammaproteobacteria bacterium]|nr:DUF3426 domain-containing protein [Gammaproteobacteria bacterium]